MKGIPTLENSLAVGLFIMFQWQGICQAVTHFNCNHNFGLWITAKLLQHGVWSLTQSYFHNKSKTTFCSQLYLIWFCRPIQLTWIMDTNHTKEEYHQVSALKHSFGLSNPLLEIRRFNPHPNLFCHNNSLYIVGPTIQTLKIDCDSIWYDSDDWCVHYCG